MPHSFRTRHIPLWEHPDDNHHLIYLQLSYRLLERYYHGQRSRTALERSLAVAARIRTGILSINGGMVYGADLPFGGYKDSGIGRQNGIAGFDQYLETKSLAWPAE
jgi:hypothetical protein